MIEHQNCLNLMSLNHNTSSLTTLTTDHACMRTSEPHQDIQLQRTSIHQYFSMTGHSVSQDGNPESPETGIRKQQRKIKDYRIRASLGHQIRFGPVSAKVVWPVMQQKGSGQAIHIKGASPLQMGSLLIEPPPPTDMPMSCPKSCRDN